MKYLIYLFVIILLESCQEKPRQLPFLGDPVVHTIQTPEGPKTDSIFPVVPPFRFTDQEGKMVSNETFRGKSYIADFFFTSCPTICPVMSRNLKKVYDEFNGDQNLSFVSFTIDPKHDSVPVLKKYAESLGADPTRWHFVTGKKEEIYKLAEKGFYSAANKADDQAGGFVHSSGLILVDKDGHLRWFYDGTSDKEVSQLIRELHYFLDEQAKPASGRSQDR